ncbi:MAG: tRNA pseudouridine(13) synthase TruD, partial [Petrotogales bacterium]
MKIPCFEKKIGILTYFTTTPGIGGKLRSIPEDFIVKEIFSYPWKKEDGRFVIAEVSSKNWETNSLVRELSKRLHISRKRIHFAGTKDKRSCSTQLMSFYNVSIDKLSQIKVKDVTIQNIYSSD